MVINTSILGDALLTILNATVGNSSAFLTLLDMPPPTASPAPQQGRRRGGQEARSQWSSSRTPFASVSARKKRKKPPSALQTASASVTVVDDESASAPPPNADNVKVLVRIRPMNEAERGLRQMRTLSLFTADRERTQQDTLFYRVPGEGSAAMTNHDSHGHTFTFDHVLDEKAGQEQVFARVGCPVVQTCLQGINTTVFAYGQTGSGKTHTMHGDMQGGEHAGLTPRILQHLFEQAGSRREGTRVSVRANPCPTSCFAWRAPVTAVGPPHGCQMRCSFVELYNESFRDLLSEDDDGWSSRPLPAWNATPSRGGCPPTPGGGGGQGGHGLRLREDGKRGVFIEGLSEIPIQTLEEAVQLLTLGSEWPGAQPADAHTP